MSAPIDLSELVEVDDQGILVGQSTALQQGDSRNESAKSFLAWTALGMLLDSPAPKSVCKKSKKESEESARKCRNDFKTVGDFTSDTVPVISPDDEGDSTAKECRTLAEKWRCGQDQDSVISHSRTPSLSGIYDEEDGDSL